jgi:hypothetical protein
VRRYEYRLSQTVRMGDDKRREGAAERHSPPRLALTPTEAAQSLGCSRDFFDDHIGPELRWITPGRLKFVAIAELEDWLRRSARADGSRILVDAAIASGVAVYVQPTVTFVYPPNGPVSEDTPVGEVLPILRSALVAEQQAERFARAGGRGVVLRFGWLDGPGTGNDQPRGDFGATFHVADAGRALLSALSLPSGIYNVCRDGERVSSERFTHAAGWHPAA